IRPQLIEIKLHNPFQRARIIECEALLRIVLNIMPIEQFLAMAILVKEPNRVVREQLLRMTGLIDTSKSLRIPISALRLVKILMIAEQQQIDYTNVADNKSELLQVLGNTELVCKKIFRASPTVILMAIPVLLRYLPDSLAEIAALIITQDFIIETLNPAPVNELVNFFCSPAIKAIIIEQKDTDFKENMERLLCQCYLHSSRTQLLMLCNVDYLRMFADGIGNFMINTEINKIVIAPRLIFLLEEIYRVSPQFVVEFLIGYDVEMMSTDIQPGVLYVEADNLTLKYKVIDPLGELRQGVLTSKDVSALPDKPLRRLSVGQIKEILQDILHVTSERKHTQLIHNGHLFSLINSTPENTSLFIGTAIFRENPRIRLAINGYFGNAPRSPRRHHHSVTPIKNDESEGSSEGLRSAIRRSLKFNLGASSGESSAVASPVKIKPPN
ncbi:MAG: hypothetical protein M3R00_06675, partial [Pseudomonadota bacterium]|nr:hypothetical protein [Pseudomonadota bacterium]